LKCLQVGATDVMDAPITAERVKSLIIHTYRAHLEGLKQQPEFMDPARIRKRSWVGVDEGLPYAYLRESM
jgi:hypothetical protein